jgi:peptidoglycan/LPS O-acetylase OafA/YrhL
MHDMINAQAEKSQNITWSVSVEEQFYLFWPLIFFMPKKIWGGIIVSIILFSIYFKMINVDHSAILYYHTFSVMNDLAVGAIFAYGVSNFKGMRSLFEKSNFWTNLVLIISVLLFLLLGDYLMSDTSLKIYGRTIFSILCALFIASQCLSKIDSSLSLHRLKVFSNWGKLTYGIYLLHPVAIFIINVSCFKLFNFDYTTSLYSSLLVNLLSLLLTMFFAKMSYKYLESYFLKFKKSYSN